MSIRMTHQTKIVLASSKSLKHGTNRDIACDARNDIPDLSSTTVHRITNRLVENGMLSFGPVIDGQKVIDSNIELHDHFICLECKNIKDIFITEKSRLNILLQVPCAKSDTSLTVSGSCEKCTT